MVVNPSILYRQYKYVTSPTRTMREHMATLFRDIRAEQSSSGIGAVVEIGSNDGLLLGEFKGLGASSVFGIEPAVNLAEIARENGVPTICKFFSYETAVMHKNRIITPDVILARHVFCHVDDWKGFIAGLELIAKKECLICIEVPYAGDTIAKCEFDQCLPPGQKIVTQEGFKEIQDIEIGDGVRTHTGSLEWVTNVFCNPYEGEMIEILVYGQNTPLSVTPEHPVYVLRNGQRKFVEAKDLVLTDRVLKPSVKPRLSWCNTMRVIHPTGNSHEPAISHFPVNQDLCKIMGFYLAEGYYYECKKGCAQVEFAFGKSESEKALAEECAASLKAHGAKGNVKRTNFGWHVFTYGHIARMLHREMGTGASKKHIPGWFYEESKPNLEHLLWAYVRGDGYVYRSGDYWRASTVSSDLAQGVALIANRLGWAVSVNYGKPLGLRRVAKNLTWSLLEKPPIDILIRVNQKKKLKVYHDGEYQVGLIRKISKRHYCGPVHNIEVSGDSSYVTMQGAVHNCYHEHLSFLSIRAMHRLLQGTALHIHKIIRYPIHGGSMLIMLRRNDCNKNAHHSVDKFLTTENITADAWLEMAKLAGFRTRQLFGLIEELAYRQKKKVCGMGASAKSTVWINASGIGKWISFIADETPQKQGRMSPGSTIPILPESALLTEKPDYAIVFAWNWLGEIVTKHAKFKEAGGRWIVPVPKVEVL